MQRELKKGNRRLQIISVLNLIPCLCDYCAHWKIHSRVRISGNAKGTQKREQKAANHFCSKLDSLSM